MPIYMVQASYAAQATAAMVKNPQDRAAAIRPMIERMGGKLHDLWLCFGEYDLVAIAEMPTSIPLFGPRRPSESSTGPRPPSAAAI